MLKKKLSNPMTKRKIFILNFLQRKEIIRKILFCEQAFTPLQKLCVQVYYRNLEAISSNLNSYGSNFSNDNELRQYLKKAY